MVDAANDVYASWKIFQILEEKRQQSNPPAAIPELVDFREYQAQRVMEEANKRVKRVIRCSRKMATETERLSYHMEVLSKINKNGTLKVVNCGHKVISEALTMVHDMEALCEILWGIRDNKRNGVEEQSIETV